MKSSFTHLKLFLIRRWSLIFLLALFLFFSIFGTGFLSLANFQDILVGAVSILLLGTGMTFVIITAGIDLSVGYTMGFSAVIMAVVIRWMHASHIVPGISIITGLIVAIIVGIVVGLVNGYLIAYLEVPPFIATLGMYGVSYGLALIVSGGFPVANLPDIVSSLGNKYLFYWLPGKWFAFFTMPPDVPHKVLRDVVRIIPLTGVFAILIVIYMIVVLSRTQFGKHTYAVGNSQQVARRVGIKEKKHLMKVYVLSSLFAAISGILYVFRFGSGHAEAGAAHMLNSIAAVVIGGASLYGGKGDIQGTVIGALIIGTLTVGMVILGVQPFYQFVTIGAVIILGVLVDQQLAKKEIM